jgi:hypothetical protein
VHEPCPLLKGIKHPSGNDLTLDAQAIAREVRSAAGLIFRRGSAVDLAVIDIAIRIEKIRGWNMTRGTSG